MSEFDPAFDYVLANEWDGHSDPFEDDPEDEGGATMYGLTLNDLRAIGMNNPTRQMLKDLTLPAAKAIYRTLYWDQPRLAEIEPQILASKMMDMHVKLGPMGAGLVVQCALAAMSFQVKLDGIIGPKTRLLIEQAVSVDAQIHPAERFADRELALGIDAAWLGAVTYRCMVNPEKTKKWRAGWIARAQRWPKE